MAPPATPVAERVTSLLTALIASAGTMALAHTAIMLVDVALPEAAVVLAEEGAGLEGEIPTAMSLALEAA